MGSSPKLSPGLRCAAFLLFWAIFSFFFFSAVEAQRGFISLDCGLQDGQYYTDDSTGINYISDGKYVDGGEAKTVQADNILRPYQTLRAFPEGERNCYNLRPLQPGAKYLVRADFFYGNYDGIQRPPSFELHVGSIVRLPVQLPLSETSQEEVVAAANGDTIWVCLVNTGKGAPLISTIQLRPLPKLSYSAANASQTLLLQRRTNFGGETQIRCPIDPYDRIWGASSGNLPVIKTSRTVVSDQGDPFQVPSLVMATAVTVPNISYPLKECIQSSVSSPEIAVCGSSPARTDLGIFCFRLLGFLFQVNHDRPSSRVMTARMLPRLDASQVSWELVRDIILSLPPIGRPIKGASVRRNVRRNFIFTSLNFLLQSSIPFQSVSALKRSVGFRGQHPLFFPVVAGFPEDTVYVALHFAELQDMSGSNQTRSMVIFGFGKEMVFLKNYSAPFLKAAHVTGEDAAVGPTFLYNISVVASNTTTLPPILNALEGFRVLKLDQLPTDLDDVGAVEDIKAAFKIARNWQGDPCVPKAYVWKGLRCSYGDFNSPRIISLDLSSSGLAGEIPSSIAYLAALRILDLSNNKISITVPDLVDKLPSLELLNLAGNKINGVSQDFCKKALNGKLSLRIEGLEEVCSNSTKPSPSPTPTPIGRNPNPSSSVTNKQNCLVFVIITLLLAIVV